jgi:signal peptidase II
MQNRLGRVVVFVGTFALTAGFDQSTKEWARASLTPGVPQPVIDGYWDWQLATNPGAAFSSFTGGAGTQLVLSIVALIALVAIGVMAARTRPDHRLQRFALALVAGGALGNLIDRVRDGAVTDFVRWRVHEHAWPIFNLADAALLIGAVLLVIAGVGAQRRMQRAATS